MTNVSRVALAALGATVLTAIATPASAQRVDRVVSFGDSFADTGIAIPVLLADPAVPPATKGQIAAVYPTNRFSGGLVYTDYIGQFYNVSPENFAVGGAFATTFPGNNNNTNCVIAPTMCPLGLQYQVDQFLNAAPADPRFPASTPSFGSSDLALISIGGNDARFYQLAGGTLAGAPIAAQASVAAATAQINRLVAAGVPTISFLAGDTGTLPEVFGNPAAQAIRSTYSSTYNLAMQGVLAGYAANGTMVHYLDANLMLAQISADPGAYGLTNGIVCPALPNPTCVIDSSGYLFYGDGLHLTSDGFSIVAQYIATQLTAALTLQAPADVGMDMARQFGRTLTTRMDLGAPRDGDMPEGLAFFIVGDGYQRSLDPGLTNEAFDVTSVGVTVGGEYGFGSGVVGIAGNYSRGRADFGTDAAKVTTDSFQIGGYAAAGLGGGFVEGYLGYGWDDHDIVRRGVVESMQAGSDGDHFIAGAKAGYLFPMGIVRIGPVAGLDYAKVNVDSYTESGDPALTLNVDDQSFSSLRGSLGLEVRGDSDNNGVQLRPFGAIALEKELDGDGRSVRFSQTASPGIVNSWNLEDASTKAYGRATVGLSARIFANGAIDAGISTTIGKKQGNETSGHLGVKLGL